MVFCSYYLLHLYINLFFFCNLFLYKVLWNLQIKVIYKNRCCYYFSPLFQKKNPTTEFYEKYVKTTEKNWVPINCKRTSCWSPCWCLHRSRPVARRTQTDFWAQALRMDAWCSAPAACSFLFPSCSCSWKLCFIFSPANPSKATSAALKRLRLEAVTSPALM